MPGYLRLLTPIMNIPGALSLLLGAVFSTYVFMPKRRVLPYSLDPNQPGDQFLFNLLIAPVAIVVNLVASLPARDPRARRRAGSTRACPATILIALGAFFPTITDSLNRAGSTELFQLGKFLGVVFLFAGLPRLGRGVPRDPGAVHLDPPVDVTPRPAARRDAEVQDAELPGSPGVTAGWRPRARAAGAARDAEPRGRAAAGR